MESLVLIAGSGDLPLKVAQGARSAGKKVIAFAFPGETQSDLAAQVSEIFWITPENFSPLLEKLLSGTIRQITSVGGIDKQKWIETLEVSGKALAPKEKPSHYGDGHLLSALEHFMTSLGVEILDPLDFLGLSPVHPGILTGTPLTTRQEEEVSFAFQISKALGCHQIGQTVVVKNKIVLAVEGVEGTDAAIRRGGELGKRGVIVAKTARPGQDLRLDRPVVGLDTIKILLEIHAAVLAIEAEKVLLVDPEASIKLARSEGLSIVARKL